MRRSAHSEGRRPILIAGVLLVLSARFPLCAASGISIHHERDHWTATIRGSLPAIPEIAVVASGDIVVRGNRTGTVNYTVTQQIFADNEQEARAAALRLDAAIERQAGREMLKIPTLACGSQTIRLELPRSTRRLTVTSQAGRIDVADVNGTVLTRNGAGRTVLDRIGGDAEVRTAGGTTTLGLIAGNLHCVSGGGPIQGRTIRGDAVFETSGGDIYVAEALGAVQAYTGAGGVRIGRAGGSVTAATRGGPIEIGRAAGVVIARNSGGPIRVASAPGVQCQTASGAISLTSVSGSVVASTTLGNIIASLFNARSLANSFLQTGEGDITVLIPSNIGVTLKATNRGRTGAIVSDFPVQLVSRGPLTIAEGRINGGGPVLQIVGKDGTISIKRQ